MDSIIITENKDPALEAWTLRVQAEHYVNEENNLVVHSVKQADPGDLDGDVPTIDKLEGFNIVPVAIKAQISEQAQVLRDNLARELVSCVKRQIEVERSDDLGLSLASDFHRVLIVRDANGSKEVRHLASGAQLAHADTIIAEIGALLFSKKHHIRVFLRVTSKRAAPDKDVCASTELGSAAG